MAPFHGRGEKSDIVQKPLITTEAGLSYLNEVKSTAKLDKRFKNTSPLLSCQKMCEDHAGITALLRGPQENKEQDCEWVMGEIPGGRAGTGKGSSVGCVSCCMGGRAPGGEVTVTQWARSIYKTQPGPALHWAFQMTMSEFTMYPEALGTCLTILGVTI